MRIALDFQFVLQHLALGFLLFDSEEVTGRLAESIRHIHDRDCRDSQEERSPMRTPSAEAEDEPGKSNGWSSDGRNHTVEQTAGRAPSASFRSMSSKQATVGPARKTFVFQRCVV